MCFLLAARSLFKITLLLEADRNFAKQTWQLFCISPATVFFTAPYSESLFSALTFTGIYLCMKGRFFPASILLAFSAATRSNGLLNIGYLIFFGAATAWKSQLRQLPCLILVMIPSLLTFFIPFMWYQAYAFSEFCTDKPHQPSVVHLHLIADNLTFPGSRVPKWCSQAVPFSYSAIQSTYWNVGFLRYFEWKQLPNFLLALPVLGLVGFYFLIHITRRQDHPIFRWKTLPFAAHATFLAAFTFFFAHVQVRHRWNQSVFCNWSSHINVSFFYSEIRLLHAWWDPRVQFCTGSWLGFRSMITASRLHEPRTNVTQSVQ